MVARYSAIAVCVVARYSVIADRVCACVCVCVWLHVCFADRVFV